MSDMELLETAQTPPTPPKAPAPRRKRLGRRRVTRLFFIALIILLAGASCAFFTVRYSMAKNDRYLDSLKSLPAEQRRINMLLMGVDTRTADDGRSDTLMLVSFDPLLGSASIMSIPRDTRVNIPGRSGHDKINSAYPIGGPDLVRRTVEAFLDIKVHHYVVIDFAGFAKIVDTLGGVTIDVPKRMYYVDNAQKLTIDLQPGVQRMNGKIALGYVRFRHDRMGDVSAVDPNADQYEGRVERQLQFARALLAEGLKPLNLLRAPALVKQLYSAIKTDISLSRLATLANAARRIKPDQMQTYVLPGVGGNMFGASYWLADEEKAREQVATMLHADERSPVQVVVLNGTDVYGLAARAAALLEAEGYNIVEIGNADNANYDKTEIVATRDASQAAKDIASALGGRVQKGTTDTDADNQVSVIVGRDYAGRTVSN